MFRICTVNTKVQHKQFIEEKPHCFKEYVIFPRFCRRGSVCFPIRSSSTTSMKENKTKQNKQKQAKNPE